MDDQYIFQWKVFENVAHTNKNFIQKFMQLFAVGPYKLKINGSKVLEEDGPCKLIHNNNDIIEYAV